MNNSVATVLEGVTNECWVITAEAVLFEAFDVVIWEIHMLCERFWCVARCSHD